jgi:hypothetical protein
MAKLPERLPRANGPTKRHFTGRIVFTAGNCLLVFVLLFDIVAIDRQPSWQDEIFVVSTGWSIARSHPPIMSVMAQYPRTDSPIQFYGPVSFEANAQLVRLFGLSVVAWRLLCLAGMILTLLLSSALVKLGGGDKWAQLLAALIIGVTESVVITLPGRWDAVTCALFLCDLLLLLRSAQVAGKALLWRAALAGVFLGFALGSTPRALTLTLAALMASLVVVLWFPRLRKTLLLGSAVMLIVGVSVQTLLLLPWGLNSLSWYAYVKQATKEDSINATSVAGQGVLDLHVHYHRTVFLVLLLLLFIGALGAVAQRKLISSNRDTPFKVFLTVFAVSNLSLMLLLLAHALGQSAYWLPPVAIAVMCWFDWGLFKAKGLRPTLVALVCACLLVLLYQDVQRITFIVLTWNRRSNNDLTAFVRRTLKQDAVVYGPVNGYFYPVELAGARYLYLYEQARAGRYSEPQASISDKLEEEICSHPTYVMWPEPDPTHQPEEEPMPESVHERLGGKAGELNQPPLSPWKNKVLAIIGPIPGKYGFPDVALYPLRSLDHCAKH